MDSKKFEIEENVFEIKKMTFGERLDITDQSMNYEGLSFSKKDIDKYKKGLLEEKEPDLEKIGIKISQRKLQLYTILYSLKSWKKNNQDVPITIENVSNLDFEIGSSLFAECQNFNTLGKAEEKNS